MRPITIRNFFRSKAAWALIALLGLGGGVVAVQAQPGISPNFAWLRGAALGADPALVCQGLDVNVDCNIVTQGGGTLLLNGVAIPGISGGAGSFASLTVNPGPVAVTGTTSLTGPLFIQPGSAVALKRVGAVIAHNIADAPTTGTLIENLYTFVIPANTLASDGESIEIDVALSTAANGNNKTMTIAFGATTMVSSGAIAANAETIQARCHIYRTAAATQKAYCSHRHSVNATDNADMFGGNRITTPAETLSGAVNLVVTGTTPTAAADLTARIAKVYWHPVGQ